MARLTEEGRRVVEDVAGRHGVSAETARVMLEAVAAGHGGQAQFNIAELGGMGQWSQGGMTMVGDMFNHGLAARVNSLCTDLSQILRDQPLFERPAQSQSQSQGTGGGPGSAGASLFVPSPGDWPAELGTPASVGTQNDMRYAYFPDTCRLALDIGGRITVYDTGDHRISGFGQAQSGGQSLSFTSQHGLIQLASLPVVGAEPETGQETAPGTGQDTGQQPAPGSAPVTGPDTQPKPAAAADALAAAPGAAAMSDDQIFSRIERLAGLFEKGILTQTEYETKKAELLARL